MHGVQCGLTILARIPHALKSPSIQTSGRDVDNAMHGLQCQFPFPSRFFPGLPPLAMDFRRYAAIPTGTANAMHGLQCRLTFRRLAGWHAVTFRHGWHALRNQRRGKAANHALRCAPTTCHPPAFRGAKGSVPGGRVGNRE